MAAAGSQNDNANSSEIATEPLNHPRDYSNSSSNENKNNTRNPNTANESHDQTQTEPRPYSYCCSTVENWMRRLEAWERVDLTSKSDCSVKDVIESTLGINLDGSGTNHDFIAAMKRCNADLDELQTKLTAFAPNQKTLARSEQTELREQEAAGVSETGRKRSIEEILKDFPSLQKQVVEKIRQAKQTAMQAEQNAIQAEQNAIQARQETYITKVCCSHQGVAKDLNYYATWGNETTIATNTEAQSTEKDGDTHSTSRVGPEAKSESIVSTDGVQGFVEKMRGDLEWKDGAYFENLKHMAVKLSSLMSLREGPDKLSLSNEEVVEKVNGIVTQILLDDEVPKNTVGLNIRGLDEITVAQPILHAIIYRLMDLVGHHDLYVSKEQTTQGKEEKESNRRMDWLVHEMREHLFQALPSMIEGVVEIKKCGMIGKEDDKRIDIAANQVLGNFAKRLRGDLNYLGIGVNCELYGVALSLSKIAIVTASLQNVGTEKVCVALNKTETVPFLTVQGLELLALALSMSLKLSKARHMTNVTLAVKQGAGSSIKLTVGDSLGSGAFGIVYKVVVSSGKDERCMSHFLKIPTSERTSFSLKDEANTLRRLNVVQGSDKVPNIPSVTAFADTLDVTLNGFVGETSGLLLSGMIGKAANAFKWTQKHREGQIRSVVKKVHDTLVAAHKQSVYHLDIRPGNIVVKPSTNSTEDMDVLVIDWGVAITDSTRFLFRGCYPYAHDELLKKGRQKSCAKADYDWASLLYTYYHLHNGDLPSQVFMEHRDRVCDAIERRLAVSRWWGKERSHVQGHGIVDKLQNILSP